MAVKRVSIDVIVKGIEAAYRRRDGYIMGSTGQDPKKWAVNSWWFTQYSGKQRTKALYWREHAARVWDCNGMAEGLYKDATGVDINSKARYNYADWCTEHKGAGMIPKKYRVPGAAVFWGDTASTIHHVAYLYKPTEDGKDWYLIEARGVMYGVVKTKLSVRKPNYWGWMEKYFTYDAPAAKEPEPEYTLGARALKKGMSGADVKLLQEALNSIGYELDVDGVYGDKTANAVLSFKKAHGIENNATYGSKAHRELMKVIGDNEEPTDSDTGKTAYVRVFGKGAWNARTGPGKEYGIVTIVKEGAILPHVSTAPNGWLQVEVNGGFGWLSPKCAEVTNERGVM